MFCLCLSLLSPIFVSVIASLSISFALRAGLNASFSLATCSVTHASLSPLPWCLFWDVCGYLGSPELATAGLEAQAWRPKLGGPGARGPHEGQGQEEPESDCFWPQPKAQPRLPTPGLGPSPGVPFPSYPPPQAWGNFLPTSPQRAPIPVQTSLSPCLPRL